MDIQETSLPRMDPAPAVALTGEWISVRSTPSSSSESTIDRTAAVSSLFLKHYTVN